MTTKNFKEMHCRHIEARINPERMLKRDARNVWGMTKLVNWPSGGVSSQSGSDWKGERCRLSVAAIG